MDSPFVRLEFEYPTDGPPQNPAQLGSSDVAGGEIYQGVEGRLGDARSWLPRGGGRPERPEPASPS